MTYLVMIEQVGQNGVPDGQPVTRNVASEKAALAVMRGAALDARSAQQHMLLSLYDGSKQMLVSYTTRDHHLTRLDAFAL